MKIKTSTKAQIRGALRRFSDAFSRHRFARQGVPQGQMEKILELSHPFKPSETLAGKMHNLSEASRCINSITISPGQVFSFWRAVGNPNNPRRFTYGRSLHNGIPVKDYGGGLCQASGIIHHAALICGLDVVERHNHSVDLYTEQTRFAPLGTDATVFYGYKDLRIRNNTDADLCFKLIVADDALRLEVQSSSPISTHPLDIQIATDINGTKHVEVYNNGKQLISSSKYLPLSD